MKIVLVSDVHCADIRTPPGDILIAAGDMTIGGEDMVAEMQWLNEWFGKQRQEKKFFVPGNHDRLAFFEQRVMRQDVVRNARWLVDEQVEVDGLKIYGSPWTPQVVGAKHWGFPLYGGSHSEEKWDEIPEGLDILVTHGPPAKIADKHWVTDSSLGCYYLRWRLEKMAKRPKVHVFGHIHSGAKYTRSPEGLENMLFLNVAISGEGKKYLPEYPVTVLDYDTLECTYYNPQTLEVVDAGWQVDPPKLSL